jgi:hypothetical protein
MLGAVSVTRGAVCVMPHVVLLAGETVLQSFEGHCQTGSDLVEHDSGIQVPALCVNQHVVAETVPPMFVSL